MHTHPVQDLPPLLYIKESDSLAVLEQQVAGTSVEDRLTRRTLNFLGHLIAEVLDNKLKQ